jgi:hypothetical protein
MLFVFDCIWKVTLRNKEELRKLAVLQGKIKENREFQNHLEKLVCF